MIRVAMLSYWHVHAWDYTKQVQAHEETVITAVWDENSERGQEAADKLGVPFVADLDQLLAREDVDAVVVDTPTSMHHDVIIKAASAGKHIFTEKVIAPAIQEVNEILDAVERAGVKLTVSLPRLNHGSTLAITDVIESGLLGELTQARIRLSHNGATANWLPEHFYNKTLCGGGALIDLGCHPMYLARLFLGLPERVSAAYGYVTGKEVEDNAVALLHYKNGAIGIVEAGFVNDHSPFSIELHGTLGSLLYGLPENTIRVRSSKQDGGEWASVELKEDTLTAFDQWVRHIQDGTKATVNIELAADLTRLMEAANTSAASGRVVPLSELAK